MRMREEQADMEGAPARSGFLRLWSSVGGPQCHDGTDVGGQPTFDPVTVQIRLIFALNMFFNILSYAKVPWLQYLTLLMFKNVARI
jgi:hypothetical protein